MDDLRILVAVAKERADNADKRATEADREREELRRDQRRMEVTQIAHGVALARIEGASSGWTRAAPWIAMAVSLALAAWGRM